MARCVTRWREQLAELSKGEAAELLKISLSTWGRIEAGTSVLSVDELRTLEGHKPGLVAMLFPGVVLSAYKRVYRNQPMFTRFRR